MAQRNPQQAADEADEEDVLNIEDAEEEIVQDRDMDMDEGDESDREAEDAIELTNNSIGHFDGHKDSIFSIAQHPVEQSIVATGSGDDLGYVFSTASAESRVRLLPRSYESDPQPQGPRASLASIFTIKGHKDSINALAFSLPKGDFLASGGLDGQLRIYTCTLNAKDSAQPPFSFIGSSQEVKEINWIRPSPSPRHSNVLALGASDGSVWVYRLSEASGPEVVEVYYLHQGSCTAGAWDPTGTLLCTVGEDSSFYVVDPFGDARAAGIRPSGGSQALVGFSDEHGLFAELGGIFSLAITPTGSLAALGGGNGTIHLISLPRFTVPGTASSNGVRAQGAKQKPATTPGGQILKTLQLHSDSVESIHFSNEIVHLLASASTDGSIVIADLRKDFAVKRKVEKAHDGHTVVKVRFAMNQPSRAGGTAVTRPGVPIKAPVAQANNWLLASCGLDGVVRTWTNVGAKEELEGHRGGGEGAGILDFVWNESQEKIATAGDDGVSLVFHIKSPTDT